MKIFLYILFGFFGGVLGGMGMGGGTLLIPMLTLFTGMQQIKAQGINLVVFIPMAICSLVCHIKNKLVDFKSVIVLSIVGVVSTILGSIVANQIDNEKLKLYYGIFLIMLGIFQFLSLWIFKKTQKPIYIFFIFV